MHRPDIENADADDFRAVAVELRHADEMLDVYNRRSKKYLIGFDLNYLADIFDGYADQLESETGN